MSRRKGPRRLSPEEEELWQRIAARTRRTKPETRPSLAPGPPPESKRPASPEPIAPIRMGASDARPPGHDLASPIGHVLRAAPLRMDSKSHKRMVRGKLVPEARIDLHGMTQAAAHPALTRFVLDAQTRGLRLVLVITGKGRPGDDDGPVPVRLGVLKHQVPHWLASGPLRAVVLQVTEAHQRHGGAGAYYVYLRRNR